ncbi:unnamed protein product [Adineta ricciae]|uniref:Methylmalonic aciduria and homocystinuria type D-like protein n=1 Tax=Adineta ricciae TaxID=249248 RepID=A0A813MQ60_ADIRI|nr:unnamed protein product [Adineta ricciae]CAF0844228.1 unnamed protein product [Adineta ricciae]
MDRLLASASSRSLLYLRPTRHLSSFKPTLSELRSRAVLSLVNQFESSKQRPSVPSLTSFDSTNELNTLFPLPGHVGFASLETKKLLKHNSNHLNNDLLEQFNTTKDILSALKKIEGECFEVRSYNCSHTIRSEFNSLFLNYDTITQPLTAITIVFQTESDMSKWSVKIEEERKQLTDKFIQVAQEISTYLSNQQYWVDFIDPSNGKPYYGPPTTDALFETDERFRHFGLNVVDLGCCRVIEHLQHGTNVFVGCIFTSAPKADPSIQHLLKEFTTQHPTQQD